MSFSIHPTFKLVTNSALAVIALIVAGVLLSQVKKLRTLRASTHVTRHDRDNEDIILVPSDSNTTATNSGPRSQPYSSGSLQQDAVDHSQPSQPDLIVRSICARTLHHFNPQSGWPISLSFPYAWTYLERYGLLPHMRIELVAHLFQQNVIMGRRLFVIPPNPQSDPETPVPP